MWTLILAIFTDKQYENIQHPFINILNTFKLIFIYTYKYIIFVIVIHSMISKEWTQIWLARIISNDSFKDLKELKRKYHLLKFYYMSNKLYRFVAINVEFLRIY